MSNFEKKKQHYKIETSTETELVREKLNIMFDESNNLLNGMFIGTIKDDIFSGHASYSTNIDVKGKVNNDKEKTIIYLTINDSSPNYKTITNTFFVVFLCLSLLIIAVNKVTDIIIYFIPIVIFGLGYLAILIKRLIFKSYHPKLKKIAEDIAKGVGGKIINVESKK